jgi:predicted DNA-binding transcriptional regulator YafY
MTRVERLTGIISFLQSRNFTPIDRMVKKFEVSERTIYRDLVSLHEIGVPIAFEKDRGYHILDNHFIPPVSFSEEEAVALTLAGRLMRRFSDHKTNVHFDNALDKIKYALNSNQKEIVETITDSDRFHLPEGSTADQNNLFAVQIAIIRKLILRITYQNRKGEVSEREIEPIGLTFYGGQWHTIAFCWKREAYRDFIVSSIQHLQATSTTFRIDNHLTMDKYILELVNSQVH